MTDGSGVRSGLRPRYDPKTHSIEFVESDVRSDLPQTLGICPICWGEFSVPDAKPGDTCPNGPHWVDGQDESVNPPMIVFVREAEVERLRAQRSVFVTKLAKILRLTYHEDMPGHLADLIRPLCVHPADHPDVRAEAERLRDENESLGEEREDFDA